MSAPLSPGDSLRGRAFAHLPERSARVSARATTSSSGSKATGGSWPASPAVLDLAGSVDVPALLRALEIYEVHRLDFAYAYLVAEAETSGVNAVASFDKTIERVPTVRRIEP